MLQAEEIIIWKYWFFGHFKNLKRLSWNNWFSAEQNQADLTLETWHKFYKELNIPPCVTFKRTRNFFNENIFCPFSEIFYLIWGNTSLSWQLTVLVEEGLGHSRPADDRAQGECSQRGCTQQNSCYTVLSAHLQKIKKRTRARDFWCSDFFSQLEHVLILIHAKSWHYFSNACCSFKKIDFLPPIAAIICGKTLDFSSISSEINMVIVIYKTIVKSRDLHC